MQDQNVGAVQPNPLQSPAGQPQPVFGPTMPAIAGTPPQEFSKPIPHEVEQPDAGPSLHQLVTQTERDALSTEGYPVQPAAQTPPPMPPPVMPLYSPRAPMYAPRTATASQPAPGQPVPIYPTPNVAAQPSGRIAPMVSNQQSRPAPANIAAVQSPIPAGQPIQQPTVVASASIQQTGHAPSRIYSHNTKAVWTSRRSNKMWSILGLLFGIISVTMLGLYWLSIGMPTTIEDIPFVQNALLRT